MGYSGAAWSGNLFGAGDVGDFSLHHKISLPNGNSYEIYKVVVDENWLGDNDYKYFIIDPTTGNEIGDSGGYKYAEDAKTFISENELTDYGINQLDFSDMIEKGRGETQDGEKVTGWEDSLLTHLISREGAGQVSEGQLENWRGKAEQIDFTEIIDVEKEEQLLSTYGQTISEAFTEQDYSGGGSEERERRRGIQKAKQIAGGILERGQEGLEEGYETDLAFLIDKHFSIT